MIRNTRIFVILLATLTLSPLLSSASPTQTHLNNLISNCTDPKVAGKLSRVICKGLELHLVRCCISSRQKLPLKNKEVNKLGRYLSYSVSTKRSFYAKRKVLIIKVGDNLRERKRKISEHIHYMGMIMKGQNFLIDCDVEVLEGKSFSLRFMIFQRKSK